MDVIRGVDFRQADEASDHVVTISNGSSTKQALISCRGMSQAWTWASGFAEHTNVETGTRGWMVMGVEPREIQHDEPEIGA